MLVIVFFFWFVERELVFRVVCYYFGEINFEEWWVNFDIRSKDGGW